MLIIRCGIWIKLDLISCVMDADRQRGQPKTEAKHNWRNWVLCVVRHKHAACLLLLLLLMGKWRSWRTKHHTVRSLEIRYVLYLLLLLLPLLLYYPKLMLPVTANMWNTSSVISIFFSVLQLLPLPQRGACRLPYSRPLHSLDACEICNGHEWIAIFWTISCIVIKMHMRIAYFRLYM